MPKPLGMHPPTPPMPEMYAQEPEDDAYAGVSRNPTSATQSSSVYSQDPKDGNANRSATPKGRYYGDLAAATRGVRGSAASGPRSTDVLDFAGPPHCVSPVASAAPYTHELNPAYGYTPAYGKALPPSPGPSRTPSPEKQARVISRTGADIADEAVLYLSLIHI